MLLVAAGAVALVVLANTGGGDDRSSVSQPQIEAPPREPDVPLQHVHGLGVNPADSALYIATHSGLYRLTGHREALLVGTSRQDLMGFTVAGPDRFLGSGHPDIAGIRGGLPGQLGLIESRDAGGTWNLVSLTGEADLHALVHQGGRVYSVDAATGRFLVSDDLSTWQAHTAVAGTSLAVDPENRDRVVAATGSELLQTLDAGHSWTQLLAPPLALVAWDRATGLWGVAADGAAHRRDPATGTWVELPRLDGSPQAIASDDGNRYAAVHVDGRTAIYVAEQDDWQLRYESD